MFSTQESQTDDKGSGVSSRPCTPFLRRTPRLAGHDSRPPRRSPAFSYVETIMSVVILGTGIVTGMQLYGSYARGMLIDSESLVAQQLAADLMAEVITKDFEDEAFPPGSFGRGGGETARRDFDDVDDYDTWSEMPPADLDGNPLVAGAYDGYQRSVRVWNVDSADLSTVRGDGSTAAKVIEVTVTRNGKLRAQLIAHRTRHSGYD